MVEMGWDGGWEYDDEESGVSVVARRNARKPCWDHVSHHHESQQAEVGWVREWDGMGVDQGWGEGGGQRVGSQGREFGSGDGEGLDEDGGWRIGGLDGGREGG